MRATRPTRQDPPPADLPDGKEVVILTEATFSLPDSENAVAVLRKAAPDFEHEGQDRDTERFSWTRKQPRGVLNPLRYLGGRQIIGSVRVSPGHLVAEGKTLSTTAKLIDELRRRLGGLRLENTRWSGLNDLLGPREASET